MIETSIAGSIADWRRNTLFTFDISYFLIYYSKLMHVFRTKTKYNLLKTGKSFIKPISWADRNSFTFILIFHFIEINFFLRLRPSILVDILFYSKKLSTFSVILNKTFTLGTRLLRVCKWSYCVLKSVLTSQS